ncbi:hypothetical protein ZWY2020_030768 [Hordeum vulgare]|nr:hypothetical protein ZWY2020_030768 [Hordeum vulgare]
MVGYAPQGTSGYLDPDYHRRGGARALPVACTPELAEESGQEEREKDRKRERAGEGEQAWAYYSGECDRVRGTSLFLSSSWNAHGRYGM